LFEAIHAEWPIPDTRILLTEWPATSVSQDGVVSAEPIRPICALDAPPELPLDAKRRLVARVSAAISAACGWENEHVVLPSATTVDTNWVLTFFRGYPLDRAALGTLMALENPMVLESISAPAASK
jgi:hypothetical protein